MGDRTYVVLHIHKDQREKFETLARTLDFGDADDVYNNFNKDLPHHFLVEYHYQEVNWGELGFEEDLREHGIPYDKTWSDGDEYSAGMQHLRFTPEGSPVCKAIYDSYTPIHLYELKKVLALPKTDEEKIQQLKDWVETVEKAMAILPWEHQLEYADKYLINKAVDPKTAEQFEDKVIG